LGQLEGNWGKKRKVEFVSALVKRAYVTHFGSIGEGGILLQTISQHLL